MTDTLKTQLPRPYWIDFSALYERSDAISQAYHSRNLVFFLGTGASKAFGQSLPNWAELLASLLSETRTENERQREEISKLVNEGRYLLAAEAIKRFAVFDTDKRDLAVDSLVVKLLRRRMAIAERDPLLHLSILDFSVPIFTTNYDNIIESLIAEYKVDSYRSTAILFGSFAKYGNLSQPEADIDVLFLTDHIARKSRVQSTITHEKLGERSIDATVILRSEFERLLRCGDPFASSVLVTGCPLEDPGDRYGILSRGFRGSYRYGVVLKNAIDRYRMRWLRLCIFVAAELQDYLLACHQWSISLMQFFIIKNYYPLDSLLAISLLGNARYTIREFTKRFNNVDEKFFTLLMRSAKGILRDQEIFRPSVKAMVQRFMDILGDRYGEDDLEMLLPGEFLQHADPSGITKVYQILSPTLNALTRGEMAIFFGYGATHVERSFLQEFAEVRKITGKRITTFDGWFFLRLHEQIAKEGIQAEEDERFVQICDIVRDQWLNEVVSGKI